MLAAMFERGQDIWGKSPPVGPIDRTTGKKVAVGALRNFEQFLFYLTANIARSLRRFADSDSVINSRRMFLPILVPYNHDSCVIRMDRPPPPRLHRRPRGGSRIL